MKCRINDQFHPVQNDWKILWVQELQNSILLIALCGEAYHYLPSWSLIVLGYLNCGRRGKLEISVGYIHFERPILVQIQPYVWLWNIFKQTEKLQVVSLWQRPFLLFFVRTIIFANYPKCTLYSMLKVTSISSILSKAQLIHMKGSHFPLFFSKKDSTKVCFYMLALICSYAFMLVSMRLYFKYKTIFPDQTRLFPMPSMPGTHWVYNISRPLFLCKTLQLAGSHMLSWPAGWYERRAGAGAAPTCRIAFLAHRDLQLFLHICPRKSHSLSLSCPARVIWHLLISE